MSRATRTLAHLGMSSGRETRFAALEPMAHAVASVAEMRLTLGAEIEAHCSTARGDAAEPVGGATEGSVDDKLSIAAGRSGESVESTESGPGTVAARKAEMTSVSTRREQRAAQSPSTSCSGVDAFGRLSGGDAPTGSEPPSQRSHGPAA